MTFRVSFGALVALALAAAPARAATPRSGVNLAHMDTTVSPCDDFYRYANGRWMDSTEIPAAYAAIGSGREMFDRNQEVLRAVLERAAAGAASESDATRRKLGLFYALLMDSARAEKEGGTPLASRLARIDAIRTRRDLVKAFAALRLDGLPQPIVLNPEADPKQSSTNIAQLWQGGFGLPERDFYFRTDPKSDSVRVAYVTVMERLLALSGTPEERARADARAVMKLETALAESALTRTQMRDPK